MDDPKKTNLPRAGHRSRWTMYGLAVAATVATLLLRLSLAPWVGDRPLLILFVIPILFSAYLGGLGPGLVSTVLVALFTDYFVMPVIHSFSFERPLDFAQWLILVLIGTLISVLEGKLHQSRRGWEEAPGGEKNPATERKVRGGFAFALACLGVIGVISYLSIVRLREDAASVEHAHQVITRLQLLLAAATDAEAGQRGYLISGELLDGNFAHRLA